MVCGIARSRDSSAGLRGSLQPSTHNTATKRTGRALGQCIQGFALVVLLSVHGHPQGRYSYCFHLPGRETEAQSST